LIGNVIIYKYLTMGKLFMQFVISLIYINFNRTFVMRIFAFS